MRGEHARRERRISSHVGLPAAAPAHGRACVSMSCARQAAGPQQQGLIEAADDGGFDADRAGPPSTMRSMRPARSLIHARRCWRNMPGQIRRRRDNRFAECAQNISRHRMRRHAHRNAVEPADAKSATGQRRLRQHQRQRSGPECFGQPLRSRVEARESPRRGKIGDMGDQRIERRASFGGVEPRDRRAIARRRRRARRPSRSGTRPARPPRGRARRLGGCLGARAHRLFQDRSTGIAFLSPLLAVRRVGVISRPLSECGSVW